MLDQHLKKLGFVQAGSDQCIYIASEGERIMIAVHVDDLVLQPLTKLLRHFNAIFHVAPCNHRAQKEQNRPPPHPWCYVVSA